MSMSRSFHFLLVAGGISWGGFAVQPGIAADPKVLPVAGEAFQLDGHEAFLILPSVKSEGPMPRTISSSPEAKLRCPQLRNRVWSDWAKHRSTEPHAPLSFFFPRLDTSKRNYFHFVRNET